MAGSDPAIDGRETVPDPAVAAEVVTGEAPAESRREDRT